MQPPKRFERSGTEGSTGHAPRCRRRAGHAFVSLPMLGILACLSASSALAAGPSISNFKVSPSSVGVAGGTVDVSATVTNATKCTLSAKHVSGFPRSVGCGPGGVREEVPLPHRTVCTQHCEKKRYGPIKIKILLSATGEGTAKASATATVSGSAKGVNCLDFKPAANLAGCDLAYGNLFEVSLKGANLDAANLEHANLYKANLESVNLESANLKFSEIFAAQMKSALLPGANLEGASANEANYNESIYSFSHPTTCTEGRLSNEFGNPGSCPTHGG